MAELKVPIRVTAKGTEETKRKLGGVEGGLRSLGKSAAMAAAGFFGARMLIQGLKSAVTASAAQELAEKKLEAALGKTSKALLAHASALQQVTMFGDETILEAQAMLAAFIKDEEQLKLATQATLDLAAAKGFDLVSAADLVGKSVGSSTNALTRYGIEVKGVVGSTERLEMLTTNVARLFGGQAAAQAETMAGTMTQMKNAVGDAAEAIGEALGPAVIAISKGLKTAAEWVSRFFGGFKPVEIEDVIAGLEGIGAEAEKIARLEKLALTRDVIELSAQMRQLGMDSGSMAKITEDLAFEEEILTDKYDQLATSMNEMTGAGIGITMSIIEKTDANILELEAQAELIRSYELAKEKLESFGIVQEETKTKTEEQTAAYVAQTDAIYGWALANQLEQQGRESVQGTFAEWLFTQQEATDARDKELEYIEILKQDYPDLAKALGHVGKQTETNKDMSSKWAGVVSDVSSMNKSASKENALVAKRAAQLEAIVNTSKEVTKVLANPPMAAYVAAMGAIQIATIEAASFAKGGDFITQGPQMMMVGDNPGGRERVQVTPLSSPNVSGPTNSFSINVSAPLVDETVVDSIIPAIQKAQRLGTA